MPKPPRLSTPFKHTLSYQLREIIEARGLTAYAAARLAGIDPGVVSRFLTGARDIRMETADKLAAALGLRLVEVARRGRGRAPAGSALAAPEAGSRPPAASASTPPPPGPAEAAALAEG